MARKRFVDNVCMQAADFHLVNGQNTPLAVFSPEWVNELGNETLENIAGESTRTLTRRAQLKREIADLEAGKKILV